MNLQQAIKDLSFPNKKMLPQEALIWARSNWEEFSIEVDCLAERFIANDTLTKCENSLLFLGLLLIVDRKDVSRANVFFTICDSNDEWGGALSNLFGEAITEILTTAFYILANKNPQPLYDLLLSDKSGQDIKIAAIETLFAQYESHQIDRETVNKIIPAFINKCVFLRLRDALGFLCVELITYEFAEYHEQFKNLLQQGLLTENIISLKEFNDWKLEGTVETNLTNGFIRNDFDIITDLSSWFSLDNEDEWVDKDAYGIKLSNIADIKTGRNEPCPCGSGKKYKKCCM